MSKKNALENGKHSTKFGLETDFTGELEFTDNLIIMGKFTGTINATGNLFIEEKSVCRADSIAAGTVVVRGKVDGDITAFSCVEMKNGSKISGNIAAKKLRIEDGVDFSGQVTMLDVEEETPDIFSMSVSEYKQALMPEAFLETEKGMEN